MYCGANDEKILDAGLWMLDEKKERAFIFIQHPRQIGITATRQQASSIKHRLASIYRMFPSPTGRFEAELHYKEVWIFDLVGGLQSFAFVAA
jgi:hypothetical protein